jgi:N-acyl-L-homoserine lactone synthetase
MQMVDVGCRKELSTKLVTSMHEFRHDVFVRRLGWSFQSLPRLDAMESDEYDTDHAVYLVISDEYQHVNACARLLPCTGPYMLRSVFPALLGNTPAPSDPTIWELSRFAIRVRPGQQGRVLSLSAFTLDLLRLVLEAVRVRFVQRLVLTTSIAIERLMLRAHIDAHRMGPPAYVEGTLCVALAIEVPEPVLHHC